MELITIYTGHPKEIRKVISIRKNIEDGLYYKEYKKKILKILKSKNKTTYKTQSYEVLKTIGEVIKEGNPNIRILRVQKDRDNKLIIVEYRPVEFINAIENEREIR